MRHLGKVGITPTQAEPPEPTTAASDLYEMAIKKAKSIRIRWNEPVNLSIVRPNTEKTEAASAGSGIATAS